MQISKISALLVGGSLTLTSCKTVNTTKAPIKSARQSKTASGAISSKPAPTGAPIEPVAASINPIELNTDDFVLVKSLDGMQISSGASSVIDYRTGNLLIPICPAADAACTTPDTYAFDTTIKDWSHKITTSSGIFGRAINYDGMLVGTNTTNEIKNFARMELPASDYLTWPESVIDASGNPVQVKTPILVDAHITLGPERSPDPRPIICDPYTPSCFAPEKTACENSATSLQEFEFDTGFKTKCAPYPETQNAIGFSTNGFLTLTDTSPTQAKILFRDLENLSANPTVLELPGTGVLGDPYSFVDYIHGFIFAFSSGTGGNQWSIVQMDTKEIVGNIPLNFTMTGRGRFFMDNNGAILELRPANAGKPAGIYMVDPNKIFTVLNDTTPPPTGDF